MCALAFPVSKLSVTKADTVTHLNTIDSSTIPRCMRPKPNMIKMFAHFTSPPCRGTRPLEGRSATAIGDSPGPVGRPEVRFRSEQRVRGSPSCISCMPVKFPPSETHRASFCAAKGGRMQCPGLWLVWASGSAWRGMGSRDRRGLMHQPVGSLALIAAAALARTRSGPCGLTDSLRPLRS